MSVVTLLVCIAAMLLSLIAIDWVIDHFHLTLIQVPHVLRAVVDGQCVLVRHGLLLVWAALWVRYALSAAE